MEDIHSIIKTFIESWQERAEYEGTLLTGSFATNTADENSDIDLRILYSSEVDYYEVGDCQIGGKSVSFMAMSKTAYEKTFQEDLQTTSKFELRRFVAGKIMDDKYGNLQQLKVHATTIFQEEDIFGLEPSDLLSEQLFLSRNLRVLKEMPTNDVFFNMAYFELLNQVFKFYANFLQADIPAFVKKWSRFLSNPAYRQANYFTEFPDELFVSDFIDTAKAANIEKLEKLYHYVIHKTGGLREMDFMVRFYENQSQAALFEFN